MINSKKKKKKKKKNLFCIAHLKAEFTKRSGKQAQARNPVRQYYRTNTQQSSQTQGSL